MEGKLPRSGTRCHPGTDLLKRVDDPSIKASSKVAAVPADMSLESIRLNFV